MPKLITVEDIKEGMELALPLKNKFGQVLLSANLRLEDKHQKILKIWGIESLYIKDENSVSEEFNYDEEAKAKAVQMLTHRIKWHPLNYNEEDLYEMALHTILEKYF